MEYNKLYVDVDGTLINDEDEPYNHVIHAVALIAPKFDEVVIWSGGGDWYADLWNRRLFPLIGFSHRAKFPFKELDSNTLAVDDLADEMRSGIGFFLNCGLMNPEEFVLWALKEQ